jgi:nitrogen-specific signal transduction histidine kinase
MDDNHFTSFASAERSSQSEIMRQHQKFLGNHDLIVFLNSVVSMVTVLNANRQIIFANDLTLKTFGNPDIESVVGQRLGKIFGCKYAFVVDGCGTSPRCALCGTERSMLDSIEKGEAVEECSLTNDETKVTLDLRVHSSFVKLDGEDLIICSLFDISNEKKRDILGRIFFHDLLNKINGINGMVQALQKVPYERQDVYMSHLTRLLGSLVDEVNTHRILILAENGEYQTAQHHIQSLVFLEEEIESYKQIALQEAKIIRITDDSENHEFISDKVLLSRILSNMIKNALEAETVGAVISVSTSKSDDNYLCFHVHNTSVIPLQNRSQLFNRSFSTKGESRGLGTYSMKLLTEKYLNGIIDFSSEEEKGTVFTVKIPMNENAVKS